jgi:hypothetical protein
MTVPLHPGGRHPARERASATGASRVGDCNHGRKQNQLGAWIENSWKLPITSSAEMKGLFLLNAQNLEFHEIK